MRVSRYGNRACAAHCVASHFVSTKSRLPNHATNPSSAFPIILNRYGDGNACIFSNKSTEASKFFMWPHRFRFNYDLNYTNELACPGASQAPRGDGSRVLCRRLTCDGHCRRGRLPGGVPSVSQRPNLSKWRYAMFGMGLVTALICPSPDLFSWFCIYIPTFGLYLIGILLCYIMPAPSGVLAPVEEEEVAV
jgi:hypothetical protein